MKTGKEILDYPDGAGGPSQGLLERNGESKTLYWSNGVVDLYQASAQAIPLPGSVECVVTSPPYYGLRIYNQSLHSVWGGIVGCEHQWHSNGPPLTRLGYASSPAANGGASCDCGAWQGNLGEEPTVEAYIAHLVECFREVRRVLKATGGLWLNLGDS